MFDAIVDLSVVIDFSVCSQWSSVQMLGFAKKSIE